MPAAATHDQSQQHMRRADVRLPDDLFDLVDQVAEAEDRTRSQVIRRAVERDMAARAPRTNHRSARVRQQGEMWGA